MILYGIVFIALSFYIYKKYRYITAPIYQLLMGIALIAYGLYLQAVSPVEATLVFLVDIIGLPLVITLISYYALGSDDLLVKAYAYTSATIFGVLTFPEPIYLYIPYIITYLIVYSFLTIVLTIVALYILAVDVESIELNPKRIVILFGFLAALALSKLLTALGSFKAATLEFNVLLDLISAFLYSAAIISIPIIIAIATRFSKQIALTYYKIDLVMLVVMPTITIFLYFILPPLAIIPILLYLIHKGIRQRIAPSAAIAVIFLIASLLLVPNTGAYTYADTIDVKYRDAYQITIDHLRLVDRPLFIDIVTSGVRLNVSDVTVHLVTNAANVGIIDGKPLYIMPFVVTRYSEENNRMLGYVALPLDRPVPEAAIVRYVEMSVAPGLLGLKDLITYVNIKYNPKGYNATEFYLIDDDSYGNKFGVKTPFWVVLLERIERLSYPVPADFAVLVDPDGNIKEVNIEELPQGISSVTAFQMLEIYGKNQRDRKVDFTAQGALWIPQSATLLETLEGDFYGRFHHVVVGDYRLRDAYFMIQTSNYESVVVSVLNKTHISLYDLRSYSFGGSRGVVMPDKALDAFAQLLSNQGVFGVQVRYPKLYYYSGHLLWISLVIEERPDADRVRGVVFSEAANTRISGFVEYSYGESLVVFLERLKDSIDATYAGYAGGGAQTQSAFVNGTVLRVGSFLTEYQGQIVEVFVFEVQNGTDRIRFLVHPAYVASMQEYYKASLVSPGDHIYAELRYIIELQSRVAYSIEI